MFGIAPEIRKWLTLGVVIATLCLLFAVLTMCQGRNTDKGRIQTEAATGRALDNVTTETEAARQSQTEKQNEVQQIPGANDRLPDNFGRNLECVRRGGERCNP